MTDTAISILKEEKAVRTSGRGFGSLGAVMMLFSVVVALIGISAVRALSEMTGQPFPYALILLPLFLQLVVGFTLWSLGSYVNKQKFTRDTLLYFTIALIIGFLLLMLGISPKGGYDFNFDTILQLIFIGYVVYGMLKLKKVSIDRNDKDPKRILRLVLAGASILIICYLIVGGLI